MRLWPPAEKTDGGRVPRAICWQERARRFHGGNTRLAGKGWEAPLGAPPRGELLPAPRGGPRPTSWGGSPGRGRGLGDGGQWPWRWNASLGSAGFFPVPSVFLPSTSPAAVGRVCSSLRLESGQVLLVPPLLVEGSDCLRHVASGRAPQPAASRLSFASWAAPGAHGFVLPKSYLSGRYTLHSFFLFLKNGLRTLGFVPISKRSRKLFRLKAQVCQKPQA